MYNDENYLKFEPLNKFLWHFYDTQNNKILKNHKKSSNNAVKVSIKMGIIGDGS